MKVKTFFLSSLIFMVSLTCFSNEKQTESAVKSPLAEIPNPTYTFDKIVEGENVLHDFIVKNNGNDTLIITKVKAG